MKKLLAGMLGLGLWCGPALLAQTDSTQTKPMKKATSHEQSMSADMREAIAFQRNKDAADARQARLESRHPSVPAVDDEHSANRAEKDPNAPPPPVKDNGPGQVKHEQQ